MHLATAALLACAGLASAASLDNPGFEQTGADGLPAAWKPNRWDGGGDQAQVRLETAGAAEGRQALSVATVATGGAGVISAPLPAPEGGLVLRLRLRASEDYAGNAPWVFAAWFAGGRFVGSTDLGMPTTAPRAWTELTVPIASDRIPAGADQLRIALATRGLPGQAPAGRLWFDDLALSPDPSLAVALKCDQFAQWTTAGAGIGFTLERGTLPAALQTIRSRVVDSADTVIDERTQPAAAFAAEGWRWAAERPGFYEVSFTGLDQAGNQRPLVSSWQPRLPSGRTLSLPRARWSFAVAAAPTRPIAARPALFGFTWDDLGHDTDVRIGDLLGFSTVRLQHVPWGCHGTNEKAAIEPERGTYRWEGLDRAVGWLSERKLRIIAQVMGTPRWASPHPEDSKTYICTLGFSNWAPKDLGDWTRFLDVLVRRYQDRIAVWELWNEPHLPGGSCYWHDTPERYAALLSSGAQAVKAAQSQAEVWIGGMGMRYVPFYRELVRLGGGAAYDRLSLHGSNCDASPFHAVDRAAGLTPRPWVDSEHHGILINPAMSGEVPDERTLAKRLVLDSFGQLARGAGLICLFEMKNQIERDLLMPARQEGWFTHAAGLFRSRPRLEPRLPALVWHTVMAQVEPGMTVRSQHRLGEVRVVACANGERDLLLAWHDGTAPLAMPAELAACGGSAIDWEGRPLAAGAPLPAGALVLIRQAERARVTALPMGEALPLVRGGKAIASGPVPHAPALWGALPAAPALTPMTAYQDGATPEAVRAGFALASDGSQVEVLVEVADPEHAASEQPGKYWQGDSVQIGFDTGGEGLGGDQVQFQIALTREGPVVWKDVAPWLGGDLPSRWTPAGRPAAHASARIDPIAGGLRYRIRIDTSELYPLMVARDRPLRCSVLVNSSRGQGRQGWVEWGAGIGKDFTPAGYGVLEWAP
ncbi:MAG: hypothetical protein L6R48_12570 [Planctomycetes bacterium]|nr:hypothetical protein [Planctomycetota bacterium]